MQRACAIVLLVLFSLSLIPPALFANDDAKLPVCCRRDGKHGCSMKSMTALKESPSGVAVKSDPKCPLFPKAAGSPAASKTGVAPLARVALAFVAEAMLPAELAGAQYRVSFSRGWQKRGPPSLLS